MRCTNCQNEIGDHSQYCPYCGYSLNKKCPQCGHLLSSHDRYCSQCGYCIKQESTMNGYYIPIDKQEKEYHEYHYENNDDREKINWKPILLSLLVLLFVTGISIYYLSSQDNPIETSQSQDFHIDNDNSYTTYVGNTHLEGMSIVDQDIIYMTNNDGYLVSLDKDFNNEHVLLQESVSYLNIYNDKIYFADSQQYLSCINKDGTDKEIIIQKPVYYLLLKEDKLYYQLDSDNESLYVLDLKTNESIKLNDCRSYCPNISDQHIYYTSIDGIYEMDLDGQNDKRIIAGEVNSLLYEDNKLYYVQNNQLFIYDLNTQQTETISSLLLATFIKKDDSIVAYTSKGLVIYDLKTKESKTLYASSIDCFQVLDNLVLVCDDGIWQVVNEDGQVYSLFEDTTGNFI